MSAPSRVCVSGIVLTDGAMADFEGSSKLAPRQYSEPVRLGGAAAAQPTSRPGSGTNRALLAGSSAGNGGSGHGSGHGSGSGSGTGSGLLGAGDLDVLDPPAAGAFASPAVHGSTAKGDRCERERHTHTCPIPSFLRLTPNCLFIPSGRR